MSRKIKVDDISTDHTLPFPETDFSPTLQRTLMRKFDAGENPGIDRDEFFKLLGRVAEPEQPAEE